MPLKFIEEVYPLLKLTQINIEYNGGIKLHQQYNDIISDITRNTRAKTKYGAQLFIYMVELCRQRGARGFKVSLDKTLFVKKKSEVSYTAWINTLEYMVLEGYGTLYIGDSFKTEGTVEYISVFELNPKAFTLVNDKSLVNAPKAKFKVNKTEAVITTIKKGRFEEEVKVAGVREYKNFVNTVNQHNLKHTFTTGEGITFDPQVYQKFSVYQDEDKNNNLEMFDSYGRYFGNYQSMSPVDRSRILIDGEQTVEGDYSSNHAFIAYERLGITCDKDFKPYLVEQDILNVTDEQARFIFKKAMMMMFNARRPDQALHQWVKDTQEAIPRGTSVRSLDWKGVELPDRNQCKAICDLIANHNKAISKYFGGFANLLQGIDAKIATEVMRILLESNVPFLVIHDSFIVPKSKSDILVDAMAKAWEIVLGSNNNCRIDFKSFEEPKIELPSFTNESGQEDFDFDVLLPKVDIESKIDYNIKTGEDPNFNIEDIDDPDSPDYIPF